MVQCGDVGRPQCPHRSWGLTGDWRLVVMWPGLALMTVAPSAVQSPALYCPGPRPAHLNIDLHTLHLTSLRTSLNWSDQTDLTVRHPQLRPPPDGGSGGGGGCSDWRGRTWLYGAGHEVEVVSGPVCTAGSDQARLVGRLVSWQTNNSRPPTPSHHCHHYGQQRTGDNITVNITDHNTRSHQVYRQTERQRQRDSETEGSPWRSREWPAVSWCSSSQVRSDPTLTSPLSSHPPEEVQLRTDWWPVQARWSSVISLNGRIVRMAVCSLGYQTENTPSKRTSLRWGDDCSRTTERRSRWEMCGRPAGSWLGLLTWWRAEELPWQNLMAGSISSPSQPEPPTTSTMGGLSLISM